MRRQSNRYPGKHFYNSDEWLWIRSVVLAYYGRNCMLCGANESEREIHVDHIVPRSVNPFLQLEFNNLQVLCEFCNIEKGTQTIDYRLSVPCERRKVTADRLELAAIMARKGSRAAKPAQRIRYVIENVFNDVLLAHMSDKVVGKDE